MKVGYLLVLILVSTMVGSVPAQDACDAPSHTIGEILDGVGGEVTVVGEVISKVDDEEFIVSDGFDQITLDFPSENDLPEIGMIIQAIGVVSSDEIDVSSWEECLLVPTEQQTWGSIKARYGKRLQVN
jgi:hypothetical protein